MILKDRVTVQIATTIYDSWGQPHTVYEDVALPAQVDPTTTATDHYPARVALEGRYRIVLPAGEPEIPKNSRITWQAREMSIDGEVQTQTIGGRPHHRELVAIYRT